MHASYVELDGGAASAEADLRAELAELRVRASSSDAQAADLRRTLARLEAERADLQAALRAARGGVDFEGASVTGRDREAADRASAELVAVLASNHELKQRLAELEGGEGTGLAELSSEVDRLTVDNEELSAALAAAQQEGASRVSEEVDALTERIARLESENADLSTALAEAEEHRSITEQRAESGPRRRRALHRGARARPSRARRAARRLGRS